MDTPLSERMLRAFLAQMIRTEAIDPDDIADAADRLDKAGDEEAAHAMRCIIIEANAPEISDWQAEQRRNRFHVIDGPEGYKPAE
ncbi:hypothetical protein WG907_04375 [Sphingobium sp. AN558]|uniref:hypothetical protein n=1 Tax=Sphingobium sp. AN558 TaxID=3133442 RepID=UPI0030BBC44D